MMSLETIIALNEEIAAEAAEENSGDGGGIPPAGEVASSMKSKLLLAVSCLSLIGCENGNTFRENLGAVTFLLVIIFIGYVLFEAFTDGN